MTSLILAAILNIQTVEAHVPRQHQHSHAHHHRAQKPKPVTHMQWVWAVGHWERRGNKIIWIRGYWALRPTHNYRQPQHQHSHR